jgi:hypothetical protein
MTTNSPPSANPADLYSLRGVLKLTLTKFLQKTDDMLPAKVVAYNAQTNTAQVQPMIVVVTTDGQQVPRAQVASVPVMQISGGGFMMRFPVKSGDLGWIKANDRDISMFKQTWAQSQPNTQRKHSFMDAIFIPQAAWNLIAVATEDANNSVWQNYAGTVKIALWNTMIKILAPAGVGIGGTPAACALLDLHSTTQGFGLPQMTTAQKNAIVSPRAGLQVWDTTEIAVSTFNGSAWS